MSCWFISFFFFFCISQVWVAISVFYLSYFYFVMILVCFSCTRGHFVWTVSVHIQYYSHYFTFGCIDFAVTVIKENFTAKKNKQKKVFLCVFSSVQWFCNGSDGSWVQHFLQYFMAFEILVWTWHSWFPDKETLVILYHLHKDDTFKVIRFWCYWFSAIIRSQFPFV